MEVGIGTVACQCISQKLPHCTPCGTRIAMCGFKSGHRVQRVIEGIHYHHCKFDSEEKKPNGVRAGSLVVASDLRVLTAAAFFFSQCRHPDNAHPLY
jgi:hypothetical protein